MKQLVNVLIILAAIAFVIGSAARLVRGGPLLGYEPVVYWRGAIGFLGFAGTLILMQIRDK